jgi:putative flippase GtrA
VFVAYKLKQWIADPVESIALQAPRALASSVLALIVDFAILEFCVRVVGASAILGAILGYLAGTVVQYVLCSVWVFARRKSDGMGFIAFTILSLVGLAITWLVIAIAHDWAGMPVEIAKIGAVSLAFTWNFLSRKYLLFRSERRSARIQLTTDCTDNTDGKEPTILPSA